MNQRRDTIVVGASSGGIQAIRELLSRLNHELPASILIVQHQSAMPGHLAKVLGTATRLPVIAVKDRERLEHGTVYIATPDTHLVVEGDFAVATRGPRENRARPSINVLFRTAAAQRSSRVIGVLLTGLLDDGVAGLDAIKRCGGLVVIQDPAEAEFSEMPRRAIEAVESDHVLGLAAIADLLPTLTREPAPAIDVPEDILIESEMAGPGRSCSPAVDAIGEHVSLACPECAGPLWKVGDGGATVYRCHTGHALSALTLLASQGDEIERALWAAVRALTERAKTLEKLAENVGRSESPLAAAFRERAEEALAHSEQARQFLLSLRITRPDEDIDAPEEPE